MSAESRPVAVLQRPTPQSLQSFSAVRPSTFENFPLGQVFVQEDSVNPDSGWYLPGSPVEKKNEKCKLNVSNEKIKWKKKMKDVN